MRLFYAALLLASVLSVSARAAEPTLTPAEQEEIKKIKEVQAAIHPQHGDIRLPTADAVLHLGTGYYFLDAADAKLVLTKIWGNPPSAIADSVGLIFPEGKQFFDQTWGAIVTYDNTGHVSDEEVKQSDYDQVIKQGQDAEDEVNKQRKQEGAEPIHLVGWAQPPSYDRATHSLIWARELAFGDQKTHTLNYDIKTLGRRGMLSVNIVDQMPHLADIRLAAVGLSKTISFQPGAQYADYKAGTDKSAGYGLLGVVAAGAGVVLAQKLGLLGIVLLFAKKGIVLIIALFVGAGAWIRNQFRRLTGRPPIPKPVKGAPPASPAPTPGESSPWDRGRRRGAEAGALGS
jgi:uncharacterized membrane-anchored protein